jgi:hypothetical protein
MPIRREKGSDGPATASDLESLTIKGRMRADGVDLSPPEKTPARSGLDHRRRGRRDHGRTDLPERSRSHQAAAGVSERTWHRSGPLRSHRPPAPVWSNSCKSTARMPIPTRSWTSSARKKIPTPDGAVLLRNTKGDYRIYLHRALSIGRFTASRPASGR